jgi:hypothetical protein
MLSHDSATLTLERWYAAHRLATPATVVADRMRDVDKQRKAVLTLPCGTPFRHVVETYTSEVLGFPEPSRAHP